MKERFQVDPKFIESKDWVNLDDLFSLNYNELPNWVFNSNVVYYLINLVNHKGYVGQTSMSLIDRWRGNNLMTHQYCIPDSNRILYRAIRKYGVSKFGLSILGSNYDSNSDRLSEESTWINNLHTCIYDSECWGYNMTYGGEDNTYLRIALSKYYPNGTPPQWTEAGLKRLRELYPDTNGAPSSLMIEGHKRMVELYPDTNGMPYEAIEAAHTPEVIARRMATDKLNHGGVLSIHTPESKRKVRESLTKLYGSPAGNLNAEWSQKKSHDSLERIYGTRMGNAVSPENRVKALEANRRNHGGILAWNTKESYQKSLDTKEEKYGNQYAPILSDESRLHASLTRIFNSINRSFNVLKNNNKDINFYNWKYSVYNPTRKLYVIDHYIDYLVNDPRWTNIMTEVFINRN